ncbi:GNAT family N-acetyltransferase [Hahella ganghwensis]|uniref:GNAT family N-acetyltransferase n=1 Tax=Hahella ganghwensis TaxID=286420 RepID=UPI00036C5193|nr:GNAT family N-acetyltransferase [Hahella ganghwensis]
MKIVKSVKDKVQRHKERHSSLDYQYIFSDSVDFVKAGDWDRVTANSTVFMSRDYLQAIEAHPPENTRQRYAIAYTDGEPVVAIACQVAEIGGERLMSSESKVRSSLAKNYKERIIVCGNLVSSGLHGVAFSENFDEETGWRIVAELLYKIRRGEKLNGKVDFAMIKDIKGDRLQSSSVVERFSYRKIQTDPDMVLELGEGVTSFDAYLSMLTSKYRGRVKKIIKSIEQAGFECRKLTVDEEMDERLLSLYLQVERKSKTRLATLEKGYFQGLDQKLGDSFQCHGILDGEDVLGFISVIKDGNEAIAYYVGFDYEVNEKHPLYFRLLQLVIESAIDMGCHKVLFGRSALEPKASLGAKPVDTYVWVRHRVPVVNFFVRKLFRNIPFDDAPERSVVKAK